MKEVETFQTLVRQKKDQARHLERQVEELEEKHESEEAALMNEM
jgi:septal ring factor EnvC (AmiA/AmiB activator)